ncbi:MAG: single-stranded DNA-binding protein [Bacteroidales bacterium]|nr:single-stranded DNA-binding protein [Bacteroidales bacterium]
MGVSRGVNKVILIGNVGKDPEIKHLDNGMVIANIRLATSEMYRNKNNEKVTNTEWHHVVLFKNQAEVAEKYVKKGDPLYIEGRIRTRSWEDKEGNKRYTTEIIGNNMQMLGGGKKSDDTSVSQGNEVTESEGATEIPDDEDDLPF